MIIGVAILAVVLLVFVLDYNRLIQKSNAITNAFGTIDAMLKKRFDLIPNLVATVQQYASHERETLERITALRTESFEGLSMEEKQAVDRRLNEANRQLMLAVENYPELKASDNFMQLQRALNETEEQLSAARRTYNACVTDYNNMTRMFPSNLVAKLFNFKEKEVLAIPEAEREAPDVKRLFRS